MDVTIIPEITGIDKLFGTIVKVYHPGTTCEGRLQSDLEVVAPADINYNFFNMIMVRPITKYMYIRHSKLMLSDFILSAT